MNTELKPIILIDVNAFSMPALEGSEKQVAWAGKIRNSELSSAVDQANRHITEMNNAMIGSRAEAIRAACKAFKQAFIAELLISLKLRDASTWIDMKTSYKGIDSQAMRIGQDAQNVSLESSSATNPNTAAYHAMRNAN